MLLLEIPSVRTRSGKWNMHPQEFWEAERQRFAQLRRVVGVAADERTTATSATASMHRRRAGHNKAYAAATRAHASSSALRYHESSVPTIHTSTPRSAHDATHSAADAAVKSPRARSVILFPYIAKLLPATA